MNASLPSIEEIRDHLTYCGEALTRRVSHAPESPRCRGDQLGATYTSLVGMHQQCVEAAAAIHRHYDENRAERGVLGALATDIRSASLRVVLAQWDWAASAYIMVVEATELAAQEREAAK